MRSKKTLTPEQLAEKNAAELNWALETIPRDYTSFQLICLRALFTGDKQLVKDAEDAVEKVEKLIVDVNDILQNNPETGLTTLNEDSRQFYNDAAGIESNLGHRLRLATTAESRKKHRQAMRMMNEESFRAKNNYDLNQEFKAAIAYYKELLESDKKPGTLGE